MIFPLFIFLLIKLTYLTWTGWAGEAIEATAAGAEVFKDVSSKTGLSIEYVVGGGGDLDFLMLVRRRIRLTPLLLLRSFFSLAGVPVIDAEADIFFDGVIDTLGGAAMLVIWGEASELEVEAAAITADRERPSGVGVSSFCVDMEAEAPESWNWKY